MIVETLVEWACSLIGGLFSALEFVQLPLDLLGTLASILQYGSWIVGADILALFAATVVFWWGVHMSIGLAVWVWDKLPLT